VRSRYRKTSGLARRLSAKLDVAAGFVEIKVSANRAIYHKFKLDQLVDYRPKGASKLSIRRGAYKITRPLSECEGELQYRIKNAAEEHERVASESELYEF
jgi:hypothetical protein